MNIFSNNIWQGWQSLKITFEDEAECDVAEIRRLLDEDHHADEEAVP